MDFINKGLTSILNIMFYGALVILVIYLFFNIVPILLVGLVITWAVIKGFKKVKNWNSNRKTKVDDNIEIINKFTSEDISNKEVIDVEYREVR